MIASLWFAPGMVAAMTNGANHSSMISNDLTLLTLEQLVNIQVASPSTKPDRSNPAATNGVNRSSVTSNDLTLLTLEQLVNIEVTSPSKKPDRTKPARSRRNDFG
ncbi:MAG TPA: hypothetical protein VL486_12070 [Verrucomicrobiae bacterium]|nr:hypothetical protein [Verrucomicrobiae bacterium]